MLSRDDIDRQGHGTVAQALAAIPQSFGGTPSDEFSGADKSNANTAQATGINLRGLGADATLVLVNGRRMAFSGDPGTFNDVSAIPAVAVERIEVLLDGASALYGSDAVGGVVNIILRKNYQGAQTTARGGISTRGDAREYSLGQVAGLGWRGGNALIALEHYDREALAGSARAFTADTDLRALGGTDHRLPYAYPGNLLKLNPATGAFEPAYAIPAGQNGVGLTPGSFIKGAVNLENYREGLDLMPHQERDSVYLAVNQALGERLALSADARYSFRHYWLKGPAQSTAFLVTPSNPYFATPDGSPYEFVDYSFYRELGNSRAHGVAKSLGLSAGGDLDLKGSWKASAYGTFAEERASDRSDRQVNTAYLSEALGGADNPATAFSTARDGFFNPFGALGNSNSQTILDFINSGYVTGATQSQITSANLQADGDLLTFPAGPVKLAIGGQVRRETFLSTGETFLGVTTPSTFVPTKAHRTVRAVFAEARVPIFGPANRRAGLERLELSLAGRIEDYDDVGSTSNPKIGVIWSPAPAVTLRASYGTSFRAPVLKETRQRLIISPTSVKKNGANVLTLLLYGGNPDLRPETATSWSAGLDYAPKALPNFKLSFNLFDTRFDHRIGQPALAGLATALDDPALAPFVTLVDPVHNAADATKVTALINDPASRAKGLYPASFYGAIIDTRYANTASLQIRGVDIDASYSLTRGEDRFDLSANAAYMANYSSQLTPTAAKFDRVNTAGYPVALRARGSVFWSRGPFGAGLTGAYVDNHHDLSGRSIGSWTTFDLNASWRFRASSGAAKGLELALVLQNLFDKDPPFYDAPEGVGYDGATATAIGRFASVRLSKAW